MHHQAVVLHYVGQTACREKDRDLFADLNGINTLTVRLFIELEPRVTFILTFSCIHVSNLTTTTTTKVNLTTISFECKKYFCKSDSPGGLYMELKLKGTL